MVLCYILADLENIGLPVMEGVDALAAVRDLISGFPSLIAWVKSSYLSSSQFNFVFLLALLSQKKKDFATNGVHDING